MVVPRWLCHWWTESCITGQWAKWLVHQVENVSPWFPLKTPPIRFCWKELINIIPFLQWWKQNACQRAFLFTECHKKTHFYRTGWSARIKNVPKKILIIYRFDSEGFSSQIPQPASMFLHSFRRFSAVIRNMIFSKAVVTWKCPEDHWKLLSSKVASVHSFRKLIFVNPIFEREAINHEKSVRTLLGHLGKGRI